MMYETGMAFFVIVMTKRYITAISEWNCFTIANDYECPPYTLEHTTINVLIKAPCSKPHSK